MPLAAFDLDGTLVDQAAAARAWAAEFVAQWELPADEIERTTLALTARRPKDEVFAELAHDWLLPISSDEIWTAYRTRMPELVRCTDSDAAALRDLRAAGWTLGIVTNGMVDNQEGKIKSTGLAELVDGWVISAEVGVCKPEAAIFTVLARKLDCPLDGWMIGDSLELDVAGGAAVGLKTAWITQQEQQFPTTEPTIVAPSVAKAVRRILTEH